MVPSPRKSATRSAFTQTWDEADAAFLDPNTLPVARIPRAWERKQQTKKTEHGKEKTIWRRFNLRSRAPATQEEDEEEMRDAQSRPVKKLQRLSPQAMEKSGSGRQGNKRAFKATRWDRRKSVLPRKNTTRMEDGSTELNDGTDIDNSQELETEDASEVTNSEMQDGDSHVEEGQSLIPEVEDRRSTFTFTMDANELQHVEAIEIEPGPSQEIEDTEGTTPLEEAAISRLFQSPAKEALPQPTVNVEVEYPRLPDVDVDTASETAHGFGLTRELEPTDDESLEREQETFEPGGHVDSLIKDVAQPETLHRTCDVDAFGEMELNASIDPQATDNTVEEADTPASVLEVSYPDIPQISSPLSLKQSPDPKVDALQADVDMTEFQHDEGENKHQKLSASVEDDILTENMEDVAPEDFTEASLQLNIQRDYEDTLQAEHQDIKDEVVMETIEKAEANSDELTSMPQLDDITDGLTFSFAPARTASAEPAPRKLHSPPPPPRVQSGPDDATMTIVLDDDTALLKDFLSRAAASKAEKAAVLTHRRESLQNRRDSDVVRHALASPRKALEDKDPNSPSKYDQEVTLDLSQTLTLNMDAGAALEEGDIEAEEPAEGRSGRVSRRSSRTKKSRLPAPASAAQAQASKIAIRRADGTEHVVLKKSDAQELAALTRTNTRKNKQGAFGVTVRLLKLAVDAANLPPIDDSTKELVVGKNVRWDEQLAYYQENPETIAERESLATPDELSMPDPATASSVKKKISKNSTPKIRRVRGLGTANGTPGKGLLEPASLLPEAVLDEKEAAQTRTPSQQLPRPKSSKIKKMTVASAPDTVPMTKPKPAELPTLEVAPVGIEPTKERKSRLAAPKKVVLPQPVVALPAEGKENSQRTGISAATPKKGIPAPKVVIPPTVGMETATSGLPRRRGRKL